MRLRCPAAVCLVRFGAAPRLLTGNQTRRPTSSNSARKPISAESAKELAPDDQDTDVEADCEPDAEPAAVRSHAESARMVSKLTETGYSLEQSREALSATKLRSVHAAVEYLVLHGSAETEDHAPGPSRKRARQAGDEEGGRPAPKGQKTASDTSPRPAHSRTAADSRRQHRVRLAA